MFKVFISSTELDLKEYRLAAMEECNRLHMAPIVMEHFEAMGVGTVEGSKEQLDKADVYVGIFAHRYGYIEEGQEKSVTELEFDYAGERGLARLCFPIDPGISWPPDRIDFENYARLQAFKARIDANLIRAQFTDVSDFRLKLSRALSEWKRKNAPQQVYSLCAFHYNEHKCSHPKYQDSDFCVFHHEVVDEKRADFQTALEALIEERAAGGASSINMRGFVFPDIELSNRMFSATEILSVRLEFQASHFYGRVVFSDLIYESDVDFSECSFHQPIKFQNCEFHHDVSFRKSNIMATCNFIGTKFRSETSFSNITFRGAANFRYAEFMEKASFRRSKFSNTVDFKGIESNQEIDFKECEFVKSADFSRARFEKLVSIRKSIFHDECTLKNVVFYSEVSAEHSEFKGNLLAENSQFREKADFSESVFQKEVSFSDSYFSAEVQFSGSSFHWALILDHCRFEGRASFHDCTFIGNLLVGNCEFRQPTEFQGTKFHNELDFTGTRFAFIKNLSSNNGVRFDQAILEDSYFWGTEVIDGYSFEDTFLLSLNLSNKLIRNCNFTGAVVSGLNTRNWSLDESTRRNTKYVYSDYEAERVFQNNEERIVYKPVLDSRVPADGNFGEGEHKDYTIQEYLRSLCVWSLSLQVPSIVRGAYLDYIRFFSEYARATATVDVEIRTRREGKKIRVEFITETDDEKRVIQNIFPSYLSNIDPDSNSDQEYQIRDLDITSQERDALVKDHGAEIANLRQRLTSKLELLENEKEKNAVLIDFVKTLKSNPPAIANLVAVKTEEQICAIHVDISGYSKAAANQPALYPAIQSKLNEIMAELKQENDVRHVRETGDGCLIFVSNSEAAAWIADDVRNEIRKFNRRKGNYLKGTRTIIGYGLAFKEQSGESVTYTGQVLIQINRIDQPMKRFINENSSEDDFPIWCTEEYFLAMDGKSSNVRFEKIGPVELDKGAGTQTVYRVILS